MCVGAKPLYASIPERISCHRKDFRRIVTRCDRQAPWVNTLSEGLQVDDLKTTTTSSRRSVLNWKAMEVLKSVPDVYK